MESKLERVFTNHCQLHTKPLSHTIVPVNLRIRNSPTAPANTDADEPLNTAELILPVIRGDDGRTIEQNLTTRVLQASAAAPRSSGDVQESAEEVVATTTRTDENGEVTALVEVPAICESCVDRISTHIKDLCRRALHKATFVPYRPPA